MKWIDLVAAGVIGQAIVGTGCMICLIIEVVNRQPIDPILAGFLGIVVGYYFRMSSGVTVTRAVPQD